MLCTVCSVCDIFCGGVYFVLNSPLKTLIPMCHVSRMNMILRLMFYVLLAVLGTFYSISDGRWSQIQMVFSKMSDLINFHDGRYICGSKRVFQTRFSKLS